MKSWQVNAQQVNKNHPINQLERRNLGSHSKNLIYPPTHPKINTKSPLKIGSVCPTTRWKQRIVFQSHHWLFRGNLLGLGSCRPCHSNPNSFFFPGPREKILCDPWRSMVVHAGAAITKSVFAHPWWYCRLCIRLHYTLVVVKAPKAPIA